jgi:hypothetical protein
MARIRSVKPALRTSRVVAKWPREVRYFWVLLWGYLDDEGRGLDIPKTIAGDCFPLDDDMTPAKVGKWLQLMATTKVSPDKQPPLCRYEVRGVRYLHSLNWDEHQRPNRPSPSMHPPCPVHEGLTEPISEPLTESGSEPPLSPQVLEFEGLTEGEVEGAAREPGSEPPAPNRPDPEPPTRCPKHLDDPDPPNCRACGAARVENDRWRADHDRAARHADLATRRQRAADQAQANRTAIDRCQLCDETGYANGVVCPHDPYAAARSRNGAAAARAALSTPKERTP